MKKNNFTRFLFSFLFIIGILGCSNSVFNNSFQNSKSNEKVIIKIGFYDEVNNLQRTAMPSNSKKYFVDFTDIELYGKQKLGTSYGSEIIIAKWKDYNALLSDDFTTDATEKLKNGNTYGFRLTAKRWSDF